MPDATSWTAEHLTALGTVGLFFATTILAIATIYLAIAATVQLRSLNKQLRLTRESETLRVCFLLDFDPTLNELQRRLWVASKGGVDYSDITAFNLHDVLGVLNFVDGIATGVLENCFHREIVKDHLGSTFEKYVSCYIRGGLNLGEQGYANILAVHDSFFPRQNTYRSKVN